MAEFVLRALGALFLCGFCVLPCDASADALKRPMAIHKVPALGLEIWTEARPEWEVRTDVKNGQSTFIAETPALTAPPAGMSWISSPAIAFTSFEMKDGARGAIQQAALNYGLHEADRLELHAASYGQLTGYEARFSGDAHGVPVDVRIFCGHQPGRPAVLMHAFTLRGRLGLIGEHIRRSWTHVRYLK